MKYYAIINNEQTGPMELPDLVKAGLMPDTYVWCKGMDDWKKADEVADICRFFRNRIFDLMHPSPQTDSAPDAPPPPVPQYMADEDYKGLKRRDFYNAVGQQIQQTYSDPDQEKMQQGMPPATFTTFFLFLAVILFFPLGIPAFFLTKKAKKQWQAGLIPESFNTASSSKMCGGIAICLGVIAWSVLIQWLLR
ncbi:MAG: GYF domain-containing protein [Prevotella sp.]|nr:GYF domain-containing protein [Prevotella sp.]MCM1075451.1 GYF domain-containing protein [Ruminococcus sp.]